MNPFSISNNVLFMFEDIAQKFRPEAKLQNKAGFHAELLMF